MVVELVHQFLLVAAVQVLDVDVDVGESDGLVHAASPV